MKVTFFLILSIIGLVMISNNMEKVYSPLPCETKWYEYWLSKKLFHGIPQPPSGKKKPFCIVIPPPNVTGSLHMGHAVNNILQDVIIRYKKMSGFEVLWMPGTDHGGIATQNVVEKLLCAEGKTRHELGREAFLKRIKQWRIETGDAILEQLKKLGCSCDWERTCFTMDEKRNRAVYEAFRILYEKGLIYRGERMVQWCPRCHTALADIEVEHEEEIGTLWHIRYPSAESSDNIVVATTRPETMLGDTAVAVHPEDKRYQKLIGKKLILPLTGRTIPIIADEFVDKTFGSGAVKVTPAHDPNDFEIGRRHNLPSVIVINFEGKMTDEAGKKFSGLDRYVCRKKVLEDLEKENLLLETKDHPHAVGRCYRCNETIEPLVSKQWFLSVGEMAKRAIEVVRDPKKKTYVQIIPGTWVKPYVNWLENLRDWCISRQILWGHRIPLWYCHAYDESNPSCKPIFGVEKPEQCPVCKDTDLTRDPDVLDTWFSSSLWPFSVFEWPEKTPELEFFYPTSILVTGHEILYLWVARMIKMGLTLVGDIPFEKVLIHGMVRDKYGKKMSKSLGNVIDPLDVAKKYGTDALRYALVNASVMGRDMQMGDDTFLGARNFTNKIWNVSRFVLMNMDGYDQEFHPEEEDLELADRWIMYRFAVVADAVHEYLKEYNLAQISRVLHGFAWSEFCDWYIELVKSRFTGNDLKKRKTVQFMCAHILDGLLKLLHPIIPFLTEEIRAILKETIGKNIPAGETDTKYFDDFNFIRGSIMETNLPARYTHGYSYKDREPLMNIIQDMIAGIRNIRAGMRITPDKKIEALFHIPSPGLRSVVETNIHYFKHLARIEKTLIGADIEKPKNSAVVVVGENQIFIPLAGLIDINKERKRLEHALEAVRKDVDLNRKKLDNKNFVTRAPSKEIEKVKLRIVTVEEKQKKILLNLKGLNNE